VKRSNEVLWQTNAAALKTKYVLKTGRSMVMTKTEMMQWLAAVLLIVSGILLLCAYSTAQVKTADPGRRVTAIHHAGPAGEVR
jgi:hypothetical protein